MNGKLLITGSNGLIGGILWKGLAESFELFGLDRQVSGTRGNEVQVDIADAAQVETALDRMPALTSVVHLAGDGRVDAEWPSILQANIVGTKNIYEAAMRHGVKRIVFASSNHVTGAYEGIPPTLHTKADAGMISVRDPIRPDSFYGVSKAAGEAIARMYFELRGIQSVCLRIGSVNAQDDPTGDPRLRSTWLSHRDLIQLVRRSLLADVQFGIYYGVSNNRGRFWDISDAERELGYHPEDDASLL